MKIRKVVSAVIRVGASHFFMQQRSADSTYASRWEFPGGKVEDGEDLKAALWRELNEELGIDAVIGEAVHTTVKPGDRTKEENVFYEIHFFNVLSYTGDLVANVGQQALAFIPFNKILDYSVIPSITLDLLSALNPPPGPVKIGEVSEAIVQAMAESAHQAWMNAQLQYGVTSRKAAWGEEFMVPFSDLSEAGREFDRIIMRAILTALDREGFQVRKKISE